MTVPSSPKEKLLERWMWVEVFPSFGSVSGSAHLLSPTPAIESTGSSSDRSLPNESHRTLLGVLALCYLNQSTASWRRNDLDSPLHSWSARIFRHFQNSKFRNQGGSRGEDWDFDCWGGWGETLGATVAKQLIRNFKLYFYLVHRSLLKFSSVHWRRGLTTGW